MGKIRSRHDNGKLFFDFSYKGKRCREQTALKNTPANQKRLKNLMEKIEAEITLGLFEYEKFFPNSPMAKKFIACRNQTSITDTPLFTDFAELWLSEMKIQWRRTHYRCNRGILDQYLLSTFGKSEVGLISKAEILNFRSMLGSKKIKKDKSLSASRINHIMTPLRMILDEAANRYNFSSPYNGIKSLKIPRSDVEPFTIDEVQEIINTVRPDFKNYYTVRFFTGMRTGEIDGLLWKFVDFKRRQILVRQALVEGEFVYTKNDGSFRTIELCTPAFNALQNQFNITGESEYVFCASNGSPLSHNNVTKRVWYPLLRHLGLNKRRPYQTRHTAATLWLASGESPEWIARQMGHSTTEMLFRVYSRYVPNLTRKDGSAFERLICSSFNPEIQDNNSTVK